MSAGREVGPAHRCRPAASRDGVDRLIWSGCCIRRGAWRPEGRQLTWGEAGKSIALFLLTAAACVGVGALGAWPALVGAAGNGMELI